MWYVVQVSTGAEERTRLRCEKRIDRSILDECFIPMYEEKKHFRGKWTVLKKILFPGYVFVVTDNLNELYKELKKVDAMKIYIRLMEAVPRWEDASVTNKYNLIYCFQKQTEVESLSNSCVEFAKEHMPKTLAQRRNLIERCKQCYSDYFAIRQQCRQIDCCRIELPVVAITEKLLFVTKMLNENFNSITELQTEFVTLEKDAETVAKIDGEMAERLRRFDENLKEWVKNRSNGPLFAVNSAMNAFFPCDYVHPWHLLAARGDKKSYSFMLYHHFDLFARIRGAGVLSCSIDSEELESKFVDIDPTTKYDIHCNNDTGDYQVRIVSR